MLRGISLDIKSREFVTLLGPSGCGKTTTLRIIDGFEQPDSGDVLFDGRRLNDVPPLPPRDQHRFPALRSVPPSERCGEHRLRPAHQEDEPVRDQAENARNALARRPFRLRGARCDQPVRRSAAACRHRACARLRAARAAARQAARRRSTSARRPVRRCTGSSCPRSCPASSRAVSWRSRCR